MAWEGRCCYPHFTGTHSEARSEAFLGHMDREGQCLPKGDTDLLLTRRSSTAEHSQQGFAHCLKAELGRAPLGGIDTCL